jgi:hypothetical protein
VVLVVAGVHDPDVGVTPDVEQAVQFVDETQVEHPAGHEFEQLAGTGMVYPAAQAVQKPELRPTTQFDGKDPETHVPA